MLYICAMQLMYVVLCYDRLQYAMIYTHCLGLYVVEKAPH